MAYFLHILDDDGHFELIDGELGALYPDLDFTQLTELSDAQYQAYLALNGREVRWVSGAFLARPVQPSASHVWNGTEWQLDETKAEELKAQQRTEMRAKINALRDEKINGGVYVEPLDKWIDSDATAERNLLSVKASFDLMGDMEIAWTCADNSLLMLNKEKLLLIWQVLMKEKTSNHANALQHKAAMEQADNPLDYDYSGGWSKTYGEFVAENATEKGAE